MHHARPSSASTEARIHALAARAKAGRLVVYAGAGLSAGAPTRIPAGSDLAGLLDEWCQRLGGGIPPYDATQLLSIADAIEKLSGGHQMLQDALPQLAEFARAEPNYGHRAIALLLLEGAVDVLTTNWDLCIERAAEPDERIHTIVEHSEFRTTVGPAVLKVHGCISRTGSLLASTADISAAPMWVGTAFASHIATKTIVFVGIGDIAEYVKAHLRALLDAAGTSADVRVVSRSVATNWSTSDWSALTEVTIPESNRIGASADDFFDDLLGAYVLDTTAGIRTDISRLGTTVAAADDALPLIAALEETPALDASYWLRNVRVGLESGKPADDHQLRNALIAAGMKAHAVPELSRQGWLRVGDESWLVVAGDGGLEGSRLIDVAERRVERALDTAEINVDSKVQVVYAGVRGPVRNPAVITDVVADPRQEDVVDGRVEIGGFIRADDVLAGVA